MAANIQEAIDDVAEDIGGASGNTPPFIAARMATWLSEMFTEAGFNPPGTFWDAEAEGERNVLDWVVPTLRAQREIAVVGQGAEAGNIAIDVVVRTLLAVQSALGRGDITADQQTSTVTAYTNAWE